MTPQEFSTKIKAKYPVYKDMDDVELAQKIVAKHPVYASQVKFNNKPQTQQSPFFTESMGKVTQNVQQIPELPKTDIPVLSQARDVTQSLANVGTGIGSSIGKGGIGIGQTFLKGANIVSNIGRALGADVEKNQYDPLINTMENIKQSVYQKPFEQQLDTVSGKIGEVAGEAAQFMAPSSIIAKTGKVAEGAYKATDVAKKLTDSNFVGKIADYVARKGIQGLNEFIGAGVTELGLSGGDVGDATKTGIASGVLSTLTHVGSDSWRKLIPQTVKENVMGAFKFGGKQSVAGATGGAIDDYVGGMQTIANNAKNIKITDIDGVEKVFDPTKTNFLELPQAYQQTQESLYKTWNDLAKKAGNKGIQFTRTDFGTVMDALKKYEGKGYTAGYSNKAKQIKEALLRFTKTSNGVTYIAPAEFDEMLALVKNINKDVNPLIDSAGSEVAQKASQAIREVIDNKITKANVGGSFQKTRDAYAQLKTMEKDIMSAWKKAMRSSGVNPTIIDGIVTLDGLMGVINANPSQVSRAVISQILNKSIKYLADPDVKLQRAFNLLINGEKKVGPTTQRFLGK